MIDHLLASPHYGERWGRYWLDVARYADTKGYVFQEDRNFAYAYTYRDYVVRSLNEDKPFDRFLVEQLAADKLDLGADKRPLAAMGYLTLGRRFLNNAHDIIDDRIDVVTRGMMGLTVACARCHDHKYDPIPAADYYSLYGVFAGSVEPKVLPLIGAVEDTPEVVAFRAKLAEWQAVYDAERTKRFEAALGRFAAVGGFAGTVAIPKAKFDTFRNRADRDALRNIQKKIDTFRSASPVAPPRAHVLNDAPRPFDPVVFLRGNPGNRGERVPRRMPAVVAGPDRKPFAGGSGRLDLARGIASPDNPLTARVFVNRVWLGHFGQGLVRTPSDFGVRSDPPTHPELLDWLATRFVRDGWSVKRLHKRIMLSATYQQASTTSGKVAQADPENRLLSHQNRRRLDFEAMRDSFLAVAGRLDRTVGGKPVDLFAAPFPTRRSIYGTIDRSNFPGTFRSFDVAGPDQHSPQRFQTTVPQQALFLMNSPFVREQAAALANRPEVARAGSTDAKVAALYRVALGRTPTADELALGRGFVAEANSGGTTFGAWAQYAQVLLLSNEFLFID